MQEFRRSVWIGFLWSIVFGTVLHFLYGWTGENRVVGLYAAINESPWEHLKLLFFPVLVYTVWEYIWVGHRWKGYVLTRAEGALLGMLTITALFTPIPASAAGTGSGQIFSHLCWVRQ